MLRYLRYTLWVLVAVVLAWFIWQYQNKRLNQEASPPVSTNMVTVDPSLAPGGDFILTDQNGRKQDSRNFKDRYRLIYFGFTYCPAICPEELGKITEVIKQLGDKASNVQPIFITVDPERDTVEVLKKYMTHFHPSILALTGTQAEIDEIIKSYRVTALKVPGQGGSDYLIDHTTGIYLMDTQGKFVTIFSQDKDSNSIVETLKEVIEK